MTTMRAADLIGQLAVPFYPRKLNALFYEIEEIGCSARLGYATPADLAEGYPRFFWSKVEPYIGSALGYLELTVEGRQWIANLYCTVFEIEHGRRHMGPEAEPKGKASRLRARRKRRPGPFIGESEGLHLR